MTKKAEIQVERSSGNVFADLRIANPEEYSAKAELAARIFKIVRSRRLTQTAAGKLLAHVLMERRNSDSVSCYSSDNRLG